MTYHISERPAAWLELLQQNPQEYGRLLAETGCVAHAAYRIAKARCLVRPSWISVPTARELYAAACELQRHVPELRRVPSPADLWNACSDAGLPVIPMHQAA